MFCSFCGTKLTEGAKFCSNCGAPVVKIEPMTQPVQTESSYPESVNITGKSKISKSESFAAPTTEQPDQAFFEQSPTSIFPPIETKQSEPISPFVASTVVENAHLDSVASPIEAESLWQPSIPQYSKPLQHTALVDVPQYAQPESQTESQWQQQYNNSQWQAPEYSIQKKNGNAGLIIGICCGTLAILIVAITMLVIFAGSSKGASSYADAINKYTDAIAYGRGEKTVDLMHEEYVDYLIESGYFNNRKELKQTMQSNSEWTKMSFAEEYGSNYQVTFIQTDIYYYDWSDLNYFNNNLDYYYDFDSKATDVVTVYYNIYITGSKGSDEETTYFEAMCIDGRWYMVPDEFGY